MNNEMNNVEIYTNVPIPTAHRFEEGDKVRHIDDLKGINILKVEELTYRVVIEDGVLNMVATYTLREGPGNILEDVEDTRDLVRI